MPNTKINMTIDESHAVSMDAFVYALFGLTTEQLTDEIRESADDGKMEQHKGVE